MRDARETEMVKEVAMLGRCRAQLTPPRVQHTRSLLVLPMHLSALLFCYLQAEETYLLFSQKAKEAEGVWTSQAGN